MRLYTVMLRSQAASLSVLGVSTKAGPAAIVCSTHYENRGPALLVGIPISKEEKVSVLMTSWWRGEQPRPIHQQGIYRQAMEPTTAVVKVKSNIRIDHMLHSLRHPFLV